MEYVLHVSVDNKITDEDGSVEHIAQCINDALKRVCVGPLDMYQIDLSQLIRVRPLSEVLAC